MNKETTSEYALDPALKKALDRVVEAGKSNIEDLKLVAEAITPVKDYIQVGSQMQEMYKELDWTNLFKNLYDPSAFSKPLHAFNEIQQAAFQQFSEGQRQLLETLTKSSQGLFQSEPRTYKPQQVMANYIDKSLDAYNSIKGDLTEQSKVASSVQAAYLAWYQQTLTTLAEPVASS